MKINNDRVYGLEESIIASGYPMTVKTLTEEEFDDHVDTLYYSLWDNLNTGGVDGDIKRAKNLASAKHGSGHDCFTKGIIVQYDLTAPEYFWRQFDRYHFHDYISSQSKMHRLVLMDLDKMCNKYVTQNTIDEVNYYINMYNSFNEYCGEDDMTISLRDGSKIPFTKQNLFQTIISNCPAGVELTARITDNYLQLKSKYHQRKNHKLEEWAIYCDWIKTLPMAEELIIGGE